MDLTKEFEQEYGVLKSLNSSLLILINSLVESNSKPEYFQTDLESKFHRFFLTNLSILKLVHGLEFENSGKTYLTRDIFSINSLSRLQLENFIVMIYLFFDGISEEEKDFRYDIYKFQGLTKQSKFSTTKPESQEKKASILDEIEIVKSKIKRSLFFVQADERTKKKFLSAKDALLVSKKDLFENYGLSRLKLDEAWSLYSNHLHSEHIGDRQFNYYYKVEKSTDKAMISPLMNNSVLTAKLCNLMLDNFESAVIKFNTFSLADKILIKKYKF
jgi:hypothetical protein